MSTNMSARDALAEVARRKEKTLAAGNRDWDWAGLDLASRTPSA